MKSVAPRQFQNSLEAPISPPARLFRFLRLDLWAKGVACLEHLDPLDCSAAAGLGTKLEELNRQKLRCLEDRRQERSRGE
jgi:hypothetical protein